MTNVQNPEYNRRQEQIIIGTILGGSSIIQPPKGKHCYLSMRGKDAKWLQHKASHLQSLSSIEPFTIEKTNRWHSCCYPIFDEMRKRFYDKKGSRKLDLDTLSSLWDVALAVWFGDCAQWKKGCLILNTHIWGLKGSKTVVQYFKIIDWNSKIVYERGRVRILIDENSSREAMKTIGHELPPFMQL
jgi:hypothetical protein